MDAPNISPEAARRSVSILGSTGSIGCNTVDLIERNPDAFEVIALTANRSVDRLAEQARTLGARMAVIADESRYGALKQALSGSNVEAAAGPAALEEAAARPAEWVMAAIVGSAGLAPTLSAVRRGAIIGLANKETLVCAGELMTREVGRFGARLLPVDSEHNAIYQVLESDARDSVDRIILTASGGPFRTKSREEMAAATPAEAVAHPNWDMGAKISVDSATMMNKGLELIEANHLFGVGSDQLEVLDHPQSVVHSMVAYDDGSVLAQLGQPDMRTPIAYTLAWPRRMRTPVARLDLAKVAQLTFEQPDLERFPALRIAREALEAGGASPLIMNAANEVAVEAFLAGRIGFLDILALVEATLERMSRPRLPDLEAVALLDLECRAMAGELAAAITSLG